MSVDHWWTDIDRRKLQYLEKKPGTLPLWSPQIPHNLA